MKLYVADNHALFWYLTNSSLLGKNASAAFDEADDGNATIYIPAIVLAEFYYLNIKLGSPLVFADVFQKIERKRSIYFNEFRAAGRFGL